MYTTEELDSYAWSGAVPESMTAKEKLYFLETYLIYSMFKQHKITRAEAEKKKATAKKNMLDSVKIDDFNESLYQCSVENSQRAENSKRVLMKGFQDGTSDKELLNAAIECIYGLTADKGLMNMYKKYCSG